MDNGLIWNIIISLYIYIYICLFHTHMVYCYIMTNIIMNTHNNNKNIMTYLIIEKGTKYIIL